MPSPCSRGIQRGRRCTDSVSCEGSARSGPPPRLARSSAREPTNGASARDSWRTAAPPCSVESPPVSVLLNAHSDPEALLRCDEVIEIDGVLTDVDLDPAHL